MIIELGHYALILALATVIVQSILPLVGTIRGDRALMAVAPAAAVAGFLLVLFSFSVLTFAYVVSDFSVSNVWQNSHSLKPTIYKITGVWGNHEGSMLLWVLILVLFGALVALSRRSLPVKLRAGTLAAQGSVSVAFLAFTLLTSNPFRRLIPAPGEGQDLNPILQDLGLAIHPPLLYVGYVGFSITYAFAVAALIEGAVEWARSQGATTIEAYPTVPRGRTLPPVSSYMGLPAHFERAGFEESARPSVAKAVMRRTVRATPKRRPPR